MKIWEFSKQWIICHYIANKCIFRHCSTQTNTNTNSNSTHQNSIKHLIQNGNYNQALDVFNEILVNEKRASLSICNLMCKAISKLKSLDEAHKIYQIMQDDDQSDLYNNTSLCTTIISMFGRCGDINTANEIWHHLVKHNKHTLNTAMCNVIMNVNIHSGQFRHAINCFEEYYLHYLKSENKSLHKNDKFKPNRAWSIWQILVHSNCCSLVSPGCVRVDVCGWFDLKACTWCHYGAIKIRSYSRFLSWIQMTSFNDAQPNQT